MRVCWGDVKVVYTCWAGVVEEVEYAVRARRLTHNPHQTSNAFNSFTGSRISTSQTPLIVYPFIPTSPTREILNFTNICRSEDGGGAGGEHGRVAGEKCLGGGGQVGVLAKLNRRYLARC